MKIKLIVLLFIGFVHKNVKSRGIDTGRPPGEAETRMYAIENDHDNSAANEYLTLVSAQENYEKNDKSPSNIQNKFNEMFSSVSYENNQYNKENDNLIIDNKKSQETIDLQTKNRLSEQNTSEDELNAMALHALKDSQTTSHQNSEDKIEPTTTQENSELKRKPHCNSGIDTEAVTKYISTRTVVINDQDMITNDVIKPTTIEKQSTMSTKSTETTKQVTANLLIDVTHDVFSTLDGLLPGIQYKG